MISVSKKDFQIATDLRVLRLARQQQTEKKP